MPDSALHWPEAIDDAQAIALANEIVDRLRALLGPATGAIEYFVIPDPPHRAAAVLPDGFRWGAAGWAWMSRDIATLQTAIRATFELRTDQVCILAVIADHAVAREAIVESVMNDRDPHVPCAGLLFDFGVLAESFRDPQ